MMKAEHRIRESKLSILRNQFNPHFLFNSLASIQGLIYKGENEKANLYIGDISRLLRKSLEYSKSDYILIAQEIQFARSYLMLEKRRFKNLFEFQIKVDSDLNQFSFMLPPLLIQPLLENAINHGFNTLKTGGKIDVLIKKLNSRNLIEIMILDNGMGFDVATLQNKSESMGINIVKERINLIQYYSGIKDVSFSIKSKMDRGTSIRILLPSISKND